MSNIITQICVKNEPRMYLLDKFCVNSLLWAIFKIPMILCDEFIIRAGTTL